MRFSPVLTALALLLAIAAPAARAQDLTALARLSGGGVEISKSRSGGFELTLEITQPVPWRVFTLSAPKRLVLDFSELDWSGFDAAAVAAANPSIVSAQAGLFRPGWSRLVLELGTPLFVAETEMQTIGEGGAKVHLRLISTTEVAFVAAAGAPQSAVFSLGTNSEATIPARQRQDGERPLVVVLDPGHGGIDPGAVREGVHEADLMLLFARELKELLLRSGNFNVVLTRDSDVFVPLETRVAIARQARADVFISLHADALAHGRATGATVYTLSEEASDIASQKLAERHDRADLLAGVDLSHQGDEVALVLMQLARLETAPRALKLADALVEGMHAATGSTHKTPRLSAAFSVLKAPDIPSVLVELGFLSSPRDRANLLSPAWRQRAAEGILDALQYWAIEDAAEAVRLRQ